MEMQSSADSTTASIQRRAFTGAIIPLWKCAIIGVAPAKSANTIEQMSLTWQQPLPPIYGELSDAELRIRIVAARETLGKRLVILGHHYQQDAVIEFADFVG